MKTPDGSRAARPTRIAVRQGKWRLDGAFTYPGAPAEGLLMNVRMVNATFEDRNRPDFDPDANTDRFLAALPQYVAHGVRAFTLNLQGGMPGYEGALNSAFRPDGSLRPEALRRMQRVIEACGHHRAAVILGCFYQRQDQTLRDDAAVRNGVLHVVRWIKARGFAHVVLEIANEYGHPGFDHALLKTEAGQVELIHLARQEMPGLLVSTSGQGSGTVPEGIARAADFLLVHFNDTPLNAIADRVAALKRHGKPIVCNEDAKVGAEGARAAAVCVAAGASWGLMAQPVNQRFPFAFQGAVDDPPVYAALRRLTRPRKAAIQTAARYFPPPESRGGWRTLETPEAVRRQAGMDPEALERLRQWLLDSDERDFAAVVIRHGSIALEVERGNSARTDARRVASVSKAICATALALASERSRGKMTFHDRAFDFIPWAQPLSDPRKAAITVRQLLNHTSGISPEATGSANGGTWEYLLGHTGDERTAKLAFDPGTGCGYSTHAFHHAALVCETVTGKPYDEFVIEALFQPLGIERWTFQAFDGDARHGRHVSHSLGLPARDLARIGYCMAQGGRWGGRQVLPRWFVAETGAPTHAVTGPEMRFRVNAQVFSHGWELPALLEGERGQGLPVDARYKPGSGGQLLAFVPSLDLVLARQTGGSGAWDYEGFLRRACAALTETK